MMSPAAPTTADVSIVVLNYNDVGGLKRCLSAIESSAEDSPVKEILVVDNASTDGSRELVQSSFPGARLIESATNRGCAGGRNLGWTEATGDIVFFIDSDAQVAPGCIDALVKEFAEESVAIAGCVVKDPGDRTTVQEAGMSIDRFGFMIFYYARRQDLSPFYASGCSLAIRRNLGDVLGVFDERFFIFEEEIDLCWRYRLAGYSVEVGSDAVVYHRAGTNFEGGAVGGLNEYATSATRVYLRERNAMATLIKNYSATSLIRILPIYLAMLLGEAVLACCLLRFGWGLQYAKAIGWNVRNLPGTLRLRRTVQSLRKVSDKELPFDRRIGKWVVFRAVGIPRVEVR
jgi:GT2 family glycosyltransferase